MSTRKSMPHGWVTVSVEQLAADGDGAITDGPFGSHLKTEHYTSAGPRVIRLQNIGEAVFLDARAHISEEHFQQLSRHEAKSGDVVVAMLGERLPRACVVPNTLGPAIVKADCVRLRVHPTLALAKFVALGLNAEVVRRQADALMHGLGRPRLGLRWFKTIEFPLAPKSEQERIVDAIDSHFTRLDHAVATLERVRANLKRYRASVLKAAVEGRLVPTEAELARAEGRDYEPASELLKRILVERRRRWEEAELAKLAAAGKTPRDDRWKARYQEPNAPDTTEMAPLPDGWCWAALEQVCQSVTDGDHLPPPQAPNGVPFLVIGDVRSGRIDFSKARFVPEDYYNALEPHRRPRIGDVLYTVTGSFGIPVLVREDRPFCVQRHIGILRPTEQIDSNYMVRVLESDLVFAQATKVATGTAQKTVPLGGLRRIVVPLAPAAEQVRVAAEVDRAVSVSDDLEHALEANSRRCARLRQSILHWAFEGKLVDQDPNDEPAAVLLERIRAERAGAEPAPAARGRRARTNHRG
ncbi:MAG: hypothetical protein HY906_25190 [Deltaproteobacteria bacterium]|nr:hypothetical protein [Deltaproteobacteria bacterium]